MRIGDAVKKSCGHRKTRRPLSHRAVPRSIEADYRCETEAVPLGTPTLIYIGILRLTALEFVAMLAEAELEES